MPAPKRVRLLTRLGAFGFTKETSPRPSDAAAEQRFFAQRLFSGVNDTGEGLRLVTKQPKKITLAEMRASGVRGL
jgi:hypothetical protein